MRIAAHHLTVSTLLLMTGLSNTAFVLATEFADKNLHEASIAAPPDSTAQCLLLPDETQGFGSVDVTDIASWAGLEKWQFMTNTDHLELVQNEIGQPYIRQMLEPTSKGSIHVVGKGALPPSSTYTLTQAIYLEPEFDWGGKNEGGKIGFGLGGGSTPTGGSVRGDGFSARLMWRGNKDGTARLAVYAYSSDRGQNLPYGDDYPLQDFEVPVGEWFSITMEITTNSNTAASDGRIRVWADDLLKLQRDNIHWQSAGNDPTVDSLMYATFHGGNSASWAPADTVFARFGSVCWQPSAYVPPQYDEHGLPILSEFVNTLTAPLTTIVPTVQE